MYFRDLLISRIKKAIPELKYELENHVLFKILPANKEDGFSILVAPDENETIIYFGDSGHHIHFVESKENLDELTDLLIQSLSGQSRVVEFRSEGIAFKWQYQEKDEFDRWQVYSEMGTMNWEFWKRRETTEIKVLANNYQTNTC